MCANHQGFKKIMATHCLDTSFLVKLLTHETGSDLTGDLLTQWLGQADTLITPSFARYEVAAVFRKKQYLRLLTDKQLRQACEDLQELPLVYVPDEQLILKAMEWSRKISEAVIYDCLFLCVAEKEGATYWTFDKKFYNKAKNYFSQIELL